MASSLLGASFRWLDPRKPVEAVNVVVQRVALEVQRDAKRFCPVDTGTLQGSITAEQVHASVLTGVEWEVGTNVYYGPFVEFGTSRMAPQSFLGRALDVAKGKYG